jgi:cytochrome bd-type quinol oxidase subunit 1
MVTLGNGITMVLLGFIGIYVGMIFQEVKRRPVYVISPSQSSCTGMAGGGQNAGLDK